MNDLWPGGLPFGGSPVFDFVVVCVAMTVARLVSSLSLKTRLVFELTPLSDLYFGNLIVDNGVWAEICDAEMEMNSIARHCATDNVYSVLMKKRQATAS